MTPMGREFSDNQLSPFMQELNEPLLCNGGIPLFPGSPIMQTKICRVSDKKLEEGLGTGVPVFLLGLN